mmetsp:Transcript_25413/g.70779  ORF Transcript_25413/g.70779 Transcript_25413/m.70779 type:complete len:235 (+) Transcript_25413:1278-1982(+)
MTIGRGSCVFGRNASPAAFGVLVAPRIVQVHVRNRPPALVRRVHVRVPAPVKGAERPRLGALDVRPQMLEHGRFDAHDFVLGHEERLHKIPNIGAWGARKAPAGFILAPQRVKLPQLPEDDIEIPLAERSSLHPGEKPSMRARLAFFAFPDDFPEAKGVRVHETCERQYCLTEVVERMAVLNHVSAQARLQFVLYDLPVQLDDVVNFVQLALQQARDVLGIAARVDRPLDLLVV